MDKVFDTVHNKVMITINSWGVVKMIYSYERVSTVNQDEKRQEIALGNIKIEKRFIDKMSGKNADRPELNKLKIAAKKCDNVYIEYIQART